MFIGHFGVALAAKKVAPGTSLGTLVFAAQFLDLLWAILLLLGIERVEISPGITTGSPLDFTYYPFSHSLLMSVLWAVLVGGIYYAVRHYARGAWIVVAAVASHWLLDVIVHRPDLPLWPGSQVRVGLGLWNSWPGSICVEVLIFCAGVWIYERATRPRDKIGRCAFWSFIAFLSLGWVSALFAGAPPKTRSIAWGAMAMWLMVPWAWWADRHRDLRS
jgi:membrane-bound metal-dependent hydrolase YbcI (DUF457 family)